MAKYSLTELRNLQEDDELDLSACGINEFPSATTQLSRLTKLDLSSNAITFLPESFCKMTRIIKLDFGNNQLHHLPDGIGFLVNLQHFNLYNNKLEDLPLSFANLKSLKWLDLKKNPLNQKLAAIAGNCSTEAECKTAAKQVVDVYMGERKKTIDAQKAQEAKLRAKVLKAQEEEKIRKYQEKKQKETVKKEEKESKQRETAAKGPAHQQHTQPKAQKNDKHSSPKKAQDDGNNTPKPRGLIRKLFGFAFSCVYYISIALLVSSTLAIALDCNGVGSKIPGTAPLCKDFSLLTSLKKPSAQFGTNVKNAYSEVFRGYHNQVKPHATQLQKKVNTQWKQFAKTDFGRQVEKIAYQVHSWIVEKFVKLQRFVKQQSDAIAAWWKKDGQKQYGQLLEGFLIGLKMVYNIVLDIAQNIFGMLSYLASRIKTFVHAWTEGGFNAALNTLNS
ncbi:unnamed protein product [Caenorhabditis sp. 36 PRJEB53466]|nr:unnamed protein product [Caenorhabditis sp. 36 PRJEB53466]